MFESTMKNGRDLMKSLKKNRENLNSVEQKIIKRFETAISNQSKYLTDEEKNYLRNVGGSDLTLDKKLELIINIEDRYHKENSNQLDFFN